jgi:nucleoside-diphosphate-sugar epimerase
MSAVLVTGASGFIGLPLLRELSGAGDEVHAISRAPNPPALPGVSWHPLDLADERAIAVLLRDIAAERMVHLAWYVEHGRFWEAPENVEWVERSLALLRAFASAGGRRAVMLGTCAEYSWTDAEAPLREEASPISPSTLYGVAKDALHRVAAAYAEHERIELAWGRLFFLYGPREAPGRLVAAVTRALLAGEAAETASGTPRRDFLHVDDVAGALSGILRSDLVGPVNVGSGVAVPLAEVVDRIAAVIGRPELLQRGALPDRPGEPPLLVADVDRLRDEVGFTPRVTLEQGIAATVEWWRQLESTVTTV